LYVDAGWSTASLVVTRSKAQGGFADVTVDCIGTVTHWTPIGSSSDAEYARVDLVSDGVAQGNGCASGPHWAKSDAPFGVVVWGMDHGSAYAYAGGDGTLDMVMPMPPP
jgi:hypothetical protein